MDFPRKPAYGEACTRCGLCCLATPCAIALLAVDGAVEGQPCPAVRFEAGRSICGVVERLGADSQVAKSLGVGMGCDSGPSPPHYDDLFGLNAPEYLGHRFLGVPWPEEPEA